MDDVLFRRVRQPGAIGRELGAGRNGLAGGAREVQQVLAGRDMPEFHTGVLTGGDQSATVGREGHVFDRSTVPEQFMNKLARMGLVKPNRAISGDCQPEAVRRKSLGAGVDRTTGHNRSQFPRRPVHQSQIATDVGRVEQFVERQHITAGGEQRMTTGTRIELTGQLFRLSVHNFQTTGHFVGERQPTAIAGETHFLVRIGSGAPSFEQTLSVRKSPNPNLAARGLGRQQGTVGRGCNPRPRPGIVEHLRWLCGGLGINQSQLSVLGHGDTTVLEAGKIAD